MRTLGVRRLAEPRNVGPPARPLERLRQVGGDTAINHICQPPLQMERESPPNRGGMLGIFGPDGGDQASPRLRHQLTIIRLDGPRRWLRRASRHSSPPRLRSGGRVTERLTNTFVKIWG